MVHAAQSLVLCVMFCRLLFVLLAIALSVFLLFIASEYRRSWHGPPPFFSNFLFTNLFSIKFLLLFHLFFLILTCSCQYSYNLMLTSNCMCRPYIGSEKFQTFKHLNMELFSNNQNNMLRMECLTCPLFVFVS